MTTSRPNTEGAWALIENEKRRDRFIRRVSIGAWTTAFLIALIIVVMAGFSASQMARAASVGAVPWTAVVGSVMPLIDVLWKLSLLIAALSTIAIFLRLRTASLDEIQLRLAALEQAIAARGDVGGASK